MSGSEVSPLVGVAVVGTKMNAYACVNNLQYELQQPVWSRVKPNSVSDRFVYVLIQKNNEILFEQRIIHGTGITVPITEWVRLIRHKNEIMESKDYSTLFDLKNLSTCFTINPSMCSKN